MPWTELWTDDAAWVKNVRLPRVSLPAIAWRAT